MVKTWIENGIVCVVKRKILAGMFIGMCGYSIGIVKDIISVNCLENGFILI